MSGTLVHRVAVENRDGFALATFFFVQRPQGTSLEARHKIASLFTDQRRKLFLAENTPTFQSASCSPLLPSVFWHCQSEAIQSSPKHISARVRDGTLETLKTGAQRVGLRSNACCRERADSFRASNVAWRS